MRVARLLILVLVALLNGTMAASAQPVENACDEAAARAERDWNVPQGVLSAVGTVESGRQPGPFGAAPWPWTINAAGRGSYFESKEAAVGAVLGLMERGYPYIDVGCFQIDIAYHPDVFHSLEEAFDPERNAQAAARLLAAERTRVTDWGVAVAHYHSATPELGGPYLQRVRAALPGAKLRSQSAQTLAEWGSIGTEAESIRTTDHQGRSLPVVIYPSVVPRAGREPQVVVISGSAHLPTLIVGQNAPAMVRR